MSPDPYVVAVGPASSINYYDIDVSSCSTASWVYLPVYDPDYGLSDPIPGAELDPNRGVRRKGVATLPVPVPTARNRLSHTLPCRMRETV